MKILSTPRMERCIGCHSCSLACARLVHKQLSWHTAGFDPESVKIPERFKQVVTWKGPMDSNYLNALQKAYAQRIWEMAKSKESSSPRMG